ncbi:hypothetical protein [Roseicyclus mahoneyensis]|uniref:Uncharacterized protein n=1 Tax=Roseicyclus mahoneyensis TaxID=164332 RepID=A0A316GM42_9RHOB|nr:hypothetical protein [Roseicyclus mahoneyensis]PWK60502.1 hypothetical protein C7455_104138 [Roseicyclus mahoneyensis]
MTVALHRRVMIPFALCLLLWPGIAGADTPSAGMRAALGAVPQGAIALEGPVPLQIEFGDPGALGAVVALQALHGAVSAPPEALALSRSLPGEMATATLLSAPDAFAAATGLVLGDLGPILTVSRSPERLTRLWIAPGAAARMVTTLVANGHDITGRQGDAVRLARGADFSIDLARREPANPFGGPLGQSTRFLVSEGLVLHAPATPILEAAISAVGPMLAEHPGLDALLNGLDAAADGAGGLVHALALLGVNGRDLLVADLAQGAEETGLLVIGVADTVTAERLAMRLSDRWHSVNSPITGQPLAALFDGPVTITAHPGAPASVTLRRSQPRDFAEQVFRNRPVESFQRLLLMGDLSALLAP